MDIWFVVKIEDSFVIGMFVLLLFRLKKNEIMDYCVLMIWMWEGVNVFFKCLFCFFFYVVCFSVLSGFWIIWLVNYDVMLVGWILLEMDEFGRSNGFIVKGYKVSIVFKEIWKCDFLVSIIFVFNCFFGFFVDLCK